MSEREPNPRADPGGNPQLDPRAAPVSEIEAEIKAEIAAEMKAEQDRAGQGRDGHGWPDPPPPVADPAAEVLSWLRGEFDEVNANLQTLSNRLGRQEEVVLRITGAQESELNSTLAELEGSCAQLRNEAATLRDTRSELAQSLPRLVSDAVESAVAATVADAVAEMRGTVAQLGAALAEALPAAVADALVPATTDVVPTELMAARQPAQDEAEADGSGQDLVSQLHEAQDEAAEWFSIVVDEAVRRAVERWLVPVVSAPPTPSTQTTPPTPSTPRMAEQPTTTAPVLPADATPATASVPAPDQPGSTDQVTVGVEPEPAATTTSEASKSPREPAPLATPGTDGRVDQSVAPLPPAGDRAPTASDEGPAPASGAVGPATITAPAPMEGTEGGEAETVAVAVESGVTCVLPGVAVGPTLAMGLSTALGRARLRRRRRRPASAPAAGLFRRDPFAGDLSRRLERFALARRDLAWSPDPAATDGGDGQRGGEAVPGLCAVVAERDGHELAVDLGTGPLAFTGPDAGDAGRALVATFLAAHPPSAGRVIVADDLLLPGRPFPGLDRFADLSAALDSLDAEITRRGATPSGHDGERPAVVLVTSAPSPDLAERLGRLVERGTAHGVSAVVVGPSIDGGGTVTIDGGGRVRDVAPPERADLTGARMFCLAPSPMSEILGVLASARTDTEPSPVVQVENEPFAVLSGTGPAPIQVRVLGPYRIDVGGQEVRSGLRAKARELLAFYLLHPEGTTLDAATEALWPEADAGRGSEWFWTALGNLRSRLRSVTGTKALKIIERDGDRYRIEPIFEVDLWRFQAALPPPGAGTGDPEWAAALQSAADMYDGELLAGVDWAWADVPREDLRRRAVDVLVSLGATRLVAGDVRGALDVLSHAIEVDPVAEQLYRRLMRLHAKQSGPDEVATTFDRLKLRLGELDLEPTVESEQLAKELAG